MIMRIATFDEEPQVDAANHAAFLKWLGEQPGLKGGWHAKDPQTGRVVSVSVWATKEDAMVLRNKQYPGPPLGLKPDSVVIYEVERSFGPG